jgi:hypothetical protein
MRKIENEISRNRESLNFLFSDENKFPTFPKKPLVASAPLTQRSARRAKPLSTDERILQEAAAARAALHQRILRSSRMAAKFRQQNAAGPSLTARLSNRSNRN